MRTLNNRHVAPHLSSWMTLLALTIIHQQWHGVHGQGNISSISGHAFFDSNKDGSRDDTNALEYGISDISVWLFNCNDTLVKSTKTDSAG
eukprot:CAMPEP_0172315624 /NCGR_PEP_ID=MMETSP1058-20130122/25809_1 /TAXON_ID=83371 /ORGANISM="Detonula confervacea, Strain CCMP 353" /LENGTH=89 /DNA_ID=CAMNT_0013029743 /DNA_START=113 /DNA_END=378 /DNA_ORIENTATION=+